MKNRFLIVGRLVAVLLLGVTVFGCTSIRHGVEITNVHGIREIYIRNAGAANWGTNMVNSIQNIDRSVFSGKVDIRVIDTSGIAYSNYNVPFGDSAFVEAGKSSSMNLFAGLGLLGVGLAALYFLSPGEVTR